MNEPLVEEKRIPSGNKLERSLELLRTNGSMPFAIFTHPCPDPDAIGSMMGMAWLLEKMGHEAVCFYDGNVSHPQNQRMCNLLDPELRPLSDYRPEDFNSRILVDTVPSHAATDKHEVRFDLVIDHHRETPNGGFNGVFLHLKAGSCCATVFQLIEQAGYAFDSDSETDRCVATAMLVGIATDTENLMSDDTAEIDFQAYQSLFEFRDPNLRQIIRYKRPKSWIKACADVAQAAPDVIEDGILIHGIGAISGHNRDMLAYIADEMLTCEHVDTVVIYGVLDGNRVEGCVRSINPAVSVPALCKEIGYGDGGGKIGKGAYSIGLGSFEEDGDDDETRCKFCEYLKIRETKRLRRIIKKMGNG